MRKHLTYSAFIPICLIASIASGATYTETFTDYLHNDSPLTSADWNVFDHALRLNRTESSLSPSLVETAPFASGGFAALYALYTGFGYDLYIQRYDGSARPFWPEIQTVVATSDYINGSALTTIGSDIVLVWSIGFPVNKVFAQRFDVSGLPVWGTPVVVHQGSSLELKGVCDVASGPVESVVVVWEDSRSGDQKIFAQKLDASGNRVWSVSDVLVQSAGMTQERTPQVAVDADGKAFVVWEENSDILMNRIEATGVPAWTNGALVTADATDDQRFPLIALREGSGVFISYKDQAFPRERVEIVARDFSGNALWPSDRIVWDIVGRIDNTSLTITPSGVLIGMGSSFDGVWRPYTRQIDFDGSFPSAQPVTIDYSGIDWLNLRAFDTVYTTDSGVMAIAQHGSEMMLLKTVVMNLTDSGEAAWSQPKELPVLSGVSFQEYASFTTGSEHSGGFSAIWMDGRNGAFDVFARSFSNPTTRIGTSDTFLAASKYGIPRSAQASDGKRILVTIDASNWPVENPMLQGQWFSSDWTPIGSPFRISDMDGNPNSTEFDVTIDSLDRAAVVWSDYRSPSGIYYQVVTFEGSRVFASDVRLSDVSGTDRDNVRIASFGDGSNAVIWISDHEGGYHIYFAQPLSDGSVTFPNVRVDTDLAISKRNADIMTAASLAYVSFSTSEGGDNYIYAVSISGASPDPEVLMGGPVNSCFGTAVAFLPPMSLVTVWSARIGTEYGIWAQRITAGVPEWVDSRVNTVTSSDIIPLLDLICPSNDTTLVLFDFYPSSNITTPHYQMLDGFGERVFSSDRPLVDPVPQFIESGAGVSSKLNGAETVQWAVIQNVDLTLNGGAASWSLSPDGGFNWYGVSPGVPLIFGTPGTDLRWRARMISDDQQQNSPEITSVTVTWGSTSSFLTPDLLLNNSLFGAGDPFKLDLQLISSGGISADVFILLDVYGSYWFWPSWTQTLDYATRTPPAGLTEEIILDFIWPTVTGSAFDLRFWVGALSTGTATLLGDIDMVEFGYE